MSRHKYPSIFSLQMEALVLITPQMFFSTRAVLNIGEYDSDIPQLKLGHVYKRDAFRPIKRK